jgi:CubicO group peptidase (beta-lactamase class C family)
LFLLADTVYERHRVGMRISFGIRLTLGLGAAFVLAPSDGSAQSPRALAVDKIFAEWNNLNSPGCAVGAVQNGRFLYKQGYGIANLDYDIPNSPEMVYYVGSDSKQFTAASIALLSLQGRLSLDDDIRRYLPEMPDYGTPIRIRNLIHHTSGIRDIYALMSLRGDRMEDVFPDSAAIALIARQKGLAFTPGSAYSYSNSGYFLLAQIVKRVTGTSLRQFAEDQIFLPLGMTHTHFHDDPGHVMKQRATSYERDTLGGYRISYLQNFDKIGAGGLYTTLDDLRKWDENFYTKRVGGDSLQRVISTRGVLTNGDTLTYAFGNEITSYRGLRTVEHGGALMGYKAYILRFPDQHFTVLMTCNLGAIDPGPLAHAVAEVFLGDKLGPAQVATAPAARQASTSGTADAVPSPADVGVLVGDYYSEDLDVTYHIVQGDGGRIMIVLPRRSAIPLVPMEPNVFRAGAMMLRFERGDARSAASGIVIRFARIGKMHFVRR